MKMPFARINVLLFLIFVCLISASSLSATTYYLDATNGANGNDGLTTTTAWKDLFKIRALNANQGPMAGDVFLFKYGEKWEGLQLYITASGTATDPIVYGAYGNPADGLPIISGIKPIDDAIIPGNWTATPNPNIWTLPLIGSPGRLFLDGMEVLRASTLADIGSLDNEGARGEWFHEGGVLYLYASQNPAMEFNLFEGSNFFYSALVDNAAYMVVEHLDLRGGLGAALGLIGCTDVTIQECALGHSGNSGLLLLDGQDRKPSSNITIKDNQFNSNFTFFYGLGSERGCGDGLRLVAGVNNCQAYNNTFVNWAHNAIELFSVNELDAGVNNNQFYDNHISAPAIPYAHPLGADGLLGKCQENQFFRNYIEDCRTTIQINGNNNRVHHNIIRGMRSSPSKTSPTAHAFTLAVYGDGLVCENNSYDHNLIIDTDESAFLVRGFGFPNQVKNNAIRNNIIYNTGKAPLDNAYNPGVGLVIYDTNLDGVGPNTYQNNLFYNSELAADFVYLEDNNTYFSTSDFNDQDGGAGNTISDNIEGNPRFTNFATQNYIPESDSPLIDAGIETDLDLDYALNPRVQGDAADIGPYETPFTAIAAEGLPVNAPIGLLLLGLISLGIGVWFVKRSPLVGY
jgi:hypothetical protein